MKRSTWDGQTIVYKYGCPIGTKLSEEAYAQLRLQLSLKRDLVSGARTFDEKRQQLWEAHPQVGQLTTKVDLCAEEIATIAERARQERVTDRTTVPRKATAAELKAAKAARAAAKVELKEAKKAAMDVVKPALTALDKQQHLLEQELRAQAVVGGLFWSTANAVLDDHRQAQQALIRLRKAGRPAERRMPRWDAPATLSTQVMSGSGMPRRSPELLASGKGPWRNVVQLTPWIPADKWPKGRGKHQHGTLTLRVAGKDNPPLVLPVVLSRPLPAEADITDVQVTRRMVADQQQISVALTLRLPHPPPKTTGETVAVRFGWKSIGDRWIRVATVATPDGPLPLPKHEQLKNVVRVSDSCNEIMAKPDWARLLERVARNRGHRDQALDEIKTKVCKVLEEDPDLVIKLTEALQREKLEVQRWRAQRRMARLWQVWPDDHPFKSELNEWRKRDKHLWQFEAHERQQVIAHRRYVYRNLAVWICQHARQIVLSGINFAELALVPEAGVSEDTQQERNARSNRQWVAPGELREVIRNAALRRGIQVVETAPDTTTEDDADDAK